MKKRNKLTTVLLLILILTSIRSIAQNKKSMNSKLTLPQKEQYDDEYLVSLLPGFTNQYQDIGGLKLHFVQGGEGSPLILLAGWPQNWWSFHKIMPMLAKHHKVIVVDYSGMGSSSKPSEGYSKKAMAGDIASLIKKLGFDKVSIAGHDIGANIAISFAGHFPHQTDKLIVLDTPHPEEDLYKLPMMPIGMPVHPWWVAFNQVKELPELLLEGRYHIVQSWIFDKMLVDKESINDFDRKVYAKAYESKEAIMGSNGWYQAFPEDIQDIKQMKMITAPCLGIGSSAGLAMLKASLPNYIENLQLKEIKDSGHFIQEERPEEVGSSILEFLKSK
ncbi:alpha/beta fold hydrolase [Pedobacter sp. AJM]|uniref:alpha/beta fold hydrolase n=1 Tax=Pedobacter sp. AJM TaxID=2003629 RepID=UPI00209BDEAE|nr:alpha/beta hydrolase [Pedobacter sp. AJM]